MKLKALGMSLLLLMSVGSQTVWGRTPDRVTDGVFQNLNLDYPGLEKVKACYTKKDMKGAARELLKYYRARQGVVDPDINPAKVKLSDKEQKRAEEALSHTFYVHDGYQPSFNYGKDIDWQYWPVKDNELRWQLHRHKWFTPMGKAYHTTHDVRYAREWALQYADWIAKNPLLDIKKNAYEGNVKITEREKENVRFAWRPLEVSHRLQDQIHQFVLFLNSPAFTPEFLTLFLDNYHRHAVHITRNYSERGNHLLFEAQRIFFAGTFFPEFKEAKRWQSEGMDILNKEIHQQVYDDGGQFELDPHYHLACINIFCRAIEIAQANRLQHVIPQTYIDTVEKMIELYSNICFPDYSNPCFSDAKLTPYQKIVKDYRAWSRLFPHNKQIAYFASTGKKGAQPTYLSKGFLTSGFFVFRNGWKQNATVMVVKAGPKGEWHCQPDNGTFDIWYNGKNLFPDSGSYIYAGDSVVQKQRDWFRQTAVHNTLTLNKQNLQTTSSKTLLWQPEGSVQTLVTENPSYTDLRHRRTVFFVDQTYFVIVDEALGNAKGTIDLHFLPCDGKLDIDETRHRVATCYDGESNMVIQTVGPQSFSTIQEEGWYSTAYRKKQARPAIRFSTEKQSDAAIRFVTLVYPCKEQGAVKSFKADIVDAGEKSLKINIDIDGKKRQLQWKTA
uniref:Heparinase II/III family protein n=1 Tax=Prevotella sp. GTC17259 TaxID=3236795 RepID=A0AB33J8Y5_9BACT